MFRKPIRIDMIVPTSKVALKTSCIQACRGDIDKATKLYEFFAKDLSSLPDFDIVPPSIFQQVKEVVGGALSWVDQNQEKIAGYYNLIQQMRGGAQLPIEPAALPDAPPIPNE